MVAQHVHDTDLRDGHAEQVGPLRHAGADEQSAVGAAHDGQLLLRRVSLSDEMFGSADEVVEHVLLLHLRTCQMPFLAILAAPSQIHLGVDASALEEGDAHGRERRRQRDVEASVAIEVDGIAAVALQSFLVGDEHGNAGAVLALEEELLRLEVGLTEAHLRFGVDRAAVLLHVVAVDGAGLGERGEREEALGALLAAADTCAADARKGHLAEAAALQIVDVDVVAGILAVRKEHLAVDKCHVLQNVFALGHHLLPVADARLVDVGHHEPVAGSSCIGEDIDAVADVLDGRILALHVVCHLDELRAFLPEVAHVEVVACPCAALIKEHHGLVFCHLHAVEPLGLHRILEEQHVVFLQCAQAVVVDFLHLVDVGELLSLLGCVVGTVEKAVLIPLRPRELAPLDVVGSGELAGGNVHHVDLHPVAAAARDGVGAVLSVVRERQSLEGYGAVGTQFVGVEKHPLGAVDGVHGVENTLILQAVVAILIPVSVVPGRRSHLSVVGNLGETPLQLGALRQVVQVAGGDSVLRFHPAGGLFAAVVFQPAVGIGHFLAEILVNGVVGSRSGIAHCLRSQPCGSTSHDGSHCNSFIHIKPVFFITLWCKDSHL